MTEAEFAKEIRSGSTNGIYFLCGDEDYLKNHYTREAEKKLGENDPMATFNVIRLDFGEGECRLGEIENALAAPPMMSPTKLTVLSFASLDSIKQKDGLLELLERYSDTPDSTVIVKASGGTFDCGTEKKPSSFVRSISKFARVVRFDYQSPQKLASWLSRHAAEYGVTLTAEAAYYMIQSCGRSMYTLSGEISKAAAYTAWNGMGEITAEVCAKCCSKTDEDDAFGLANALTDGDTAAAYALLGVKMRLRQDPYMLLGQIAKTFSDLAAASIFIREGRDVSEFAKGMKIHEYRAGLYYKSAKKASYSYFMNAVELCREAERKMKTLSNRGYGELELLIGLLSPALFTEPVPEEKKDYEEEE